jgi:hypothetical protein
LKDGPVISEKKKILRKLKQVKRDLAKSPSPELETALLDLRVDLNYILVRHLHSPRAIALTCFSTIPKRGNTFHYSLRSSSPLRHQKLTAPTIVSGKGKNSDRRFAMLWLLAICLEIQKTKTRDQKRQVAFSPPRIPQHHESIKRKDVGKVWIKLKRSLRKMISSVKMKKSDSFHDSLCTLLTTFTMINADVQESAFRRCSKLNVVYFFKARRNTNSRHTMMRKFLNGSRFSLCSLGENISFFRR